MALDSGNTIDWEHGQPWCRDGVSVRDLTLLNPVQLIDAWGNPGEQPVLVSIHVALRRPFKSAASSDAVDESTVHYFELAEAIRNRDSIRRSTLDQQAEGIEGELWSLKEQKGLADDLIERVEVEVLLPKASMLGESVRYRRRTHCKEDSKQRETTRSLHLQNVCVPTLIGVLDFERTGKQPVVINLWLEKVPSDASDIYSELERDLVKVCAMLSWSAKFTLFSLTVPLELRLTAKTDS